ncbi:proline-rich protein 2-like, partial [Mustela nigripes]|uniref:proline-rich protein 2-like n=1 Tax=Mustela nigripes TaxID=77151 RepID=UPI002814E817
CPLSPSGTTFRRNREHRAVHPWKKSKSKTRITYCGINHALSCSSPYANGDPRERPSPDAAPAPRPPPGRPDRRLPRAPPHTSLGRCSRRPRAHSPLSRGHSRTPRGRRAGPTRGRGGPRRLPRSLPSRDPRGPREQRPGRRAPVRAHPASRTPSARSPTLRPPRGDPSPPKRGLPRVPPRLFGRRSVHEASGPPATGAPAPPSVSLPLPTSGSEAPSRGPLARPRQRPA